MQTFISHLGRTVSVALSTVTTFNWSQLVTLY